MKPIDSLLILLLALVVADGLSGGSVAKTFLLAGRAISIAALT
jgi:hypothetical protein